MMLIDDFKKKYPRYWSVWLGAASVLLSILEILNSLGSVIPALEGMVSPGVFAGLSAASAFAGLIARALKQSSLYEEET